MPGHDAWPPYDLYDDGYEPYEDEDPPRSWLEPATPHPHRAPEPVAEPVVTVGERALPPVLVVPAHPLPSGGLEIELSALADGQVAGVVFSTVAALIERLGRYQPWIMAATTALWRQLSSAGVTTIVLDPAPGVMDAEWTQRRLGGLTEVLS